MSPNNVDHFPSGLSTNFKIFVSKFTSKESNIIDTKISKKFSRSNSFEF